MDNVDTFLQEEMKTGHGPASSKLLDLAAYLGETYSFWTQDIFRHSFLLNLSYLLSSVISLSLLIYYFQYSSVFGGTICFLKMTFNYLGGFDPS